MLYKIILFCFYTMASALQKGMNDKQKAFWCFGVSFGGAHRLPSS
jgi:hypothetical protein